MQVEVFIRNTDELQTIELNPEVWCHDFSPQLISLYNRYSLFNRRSNISKTKTKREVSGGGRKPWRQKGTGRARQGSIRSPQWRGGGVVFGPTGEQSYQISVNKKIRRKALSSLLSKKMFEKEIFIVGNLNFANYKTKDALYFLKDLNLENEKVLLVFSYPDENSEQMRKSFENLRNVNLTNTLQINVPKILASRFVVLTRSAVVELEKKLS